MQRARAKMEKDVERKDVVGVRNTDRKSWKWGILLEMLMSACNLEIAQRTCQPR